MFPVYLLISITLFPTCTSIFFDVKRFAAVSKDGNEPYIPINYFLNKKKRRSICLFMFCWNRQGNCKSMSDCCECKCRRSKTFFSDPRGCLDGDEMTNMTKNVGNQCLFATKKFGFEYVPLFDNHSRFRNIELKLPRRNIPLDGEKNTCNVGAIYDHDYHGHKLMFDRNRCSELFQVDQKKDGLYLNFLSSNTTIWNGFRGRLLSLDIDCYSPQKGRMFSSCFLFQVEGKYVEEPDYDEPPEIPAGYPCHKKSLKVVTSIITGPATTTERRTNPQTTSLTTSTSPSSTPSKPTKAISSTEQPKKTTSSTTLPPTTLPSTTLSQKTTTKPSKPKTTSKTTDQRNMLKPTTKPVENTSPTIIFVPANDSLTGTTIGILTGLGSGLAIVMICVIIWILIKKRKDIFQTQQVTTQVYNSEGNPYGEHGFHYDVPKVNAKPVERHSSVRLSSNSAGSYKFIAGDDDRPSIGFDREYSYIGEKELLDDTEFEGRDNTILLQNRGSKKSADMSKRPLPEKPLESGNPYYSVASFTEELVEPEEKVSEPNDLYSLYSTIDDIKQP